MQSTEFGYMHGRFQPFHIGHLEAVKFALENCQTLVIGISNPFRLPPIIDDCFPTDASTSMLQARLPENNPWPYWMRLLMIRESLRLEGIDLARVIPIPNLNNTGLPVNEMRFPKALTTIFLRPKQPHNRAILEQYIEDGWRVIQVPDTGQNASISGSLVRQKIASNHSNWKSLVPAGTAAVIDSFEKFLEYG